MIHESFGNVKIFRPRRISEIRIREKAENNLRAMFSEGIYTSSQEINLILQHQFKFYSKILEDLLPRIASRHFMEFILFQFDQTALIEKLYKEKQLPSEKDTRWKELGSVFRRTVKFLAESVTLIQPDKVPKIPNESLELLLDEVWICAEEMVHLYLISDQTFAIFPNDSILTIFPKGKFDLINLDLRKDCLIHEDVRRDTANRSQFVGQGQSTYLSNIKNHDKYLGDLLKKKLGASYLEVICFLCDLIEKAQPTPNSFSTLFLNKSEVLKIGNKVTNISKENLNKILAGFTLTKENMGLEGRELWKPKTRIQSLSKRILSNTSSNWRPPCFFKTNGF